MGDRFVSSLLALSLCSAPIHHHLSPHSSINPLTLQTPILLSCLNPAPTSFFSSPFRPLPSSSPGSTPTNDACILIVLSDSSPSVPILFATGSRNKGRARGIEKKRSPKLNSRACTFDWTDRPTTSRSTVRASYSCELPRPTALLQHHSGCSFPPFCLCCHSLLDNRSTF